MQVAARTETHVLSGQRCWRGAAHVDVDAVLAHVLDELGVGALAAELSQSDIANAFDLRTSFSCASAKTCSSTNMPAKSEGSMRSTTHA